jgi:hypothetical protein
MFVPGVVFPVELYTVNDEAPDTQPRRQLSRPCDIQEYFDEVYAQFILLEQVPMPKGESSWYNRIVL